MSGLCPTCTGKGETCINGNWLQCKACRGSGESSKHSTSQAEVRDGVKPQRWRETLLAVLSALDVATGDSDPNIDPDMTDDDVRDEYPAVWAMQQLSALLAAQPAKPEPQGGDDVVPQPESYLAGDAEEVAESLSDDAELVRQQLGPDNEVSENMERAAEILRTATSAEPAQAACPVCKGRRESFNDVHNRMMTCSGCKGTGSASSTEPAQAAQSITLTVDHLKKAANYAWKHGGWTLENILIGCEEMFLDIQREPNPSKDG